MSPRWVVGSPLSIAAAALILTATQGWGGLEPGDVLNEKNWQQAAGMLPPEILEHYRRGEYASPILSWPEGQQRWGVDFVEGTRRNRGRFTVGKLGTIIDKATGRQPPYLIGFPFPDIDRRDEQAGIKILWNYFYEKWYSGNTHHLVPLTWVGREGPEREALQEVYYLYYDAQPRKLRPATNPGNLLSQFLSATVAPADLYGTVALGWRYRDAHKRDSAWAYVPALRRIRAVSPSNRSDGFLGSDMSQDDGPFFDGKPEDFAWRLAGEAEAFRFVDPYSLRKEVEFRALADGGWRIRRTDGPFAGFQIPGWKGIAWAPVGLALAKRRHWIIEGTPRDPYYLYGKIQLFIDTETFDGSWNRKFNWRGEPTNIYFNTSTLNLSPDGKNYFMASPAAVNIAENLKLGRATMAGQRPPGIKDPFYDFRIPLRPAFFNNQMLMRFGK